MPRLLLVDDNPSIHKIAETLLAASDVELACAASGAEALALIEKGERFDVAMLDISMLGMDGWELLSRFRKLDATALMPVAMMAGVLDVVDPEKLRLAPIQGFLKKPVELRDLADRVKRLIEIPNDLLLLRPEDLYPGEPTLKVSEVPSLEPEGLQEVEAEADADTEPGLNPPIDADAWPEWKPAVESDIEPPAETAVEPEAEIPAQAPPEAFADETLDLEELDLAGLQNLAPPPPEALEIPVEANPVDLAEDIGEDLREELADFPGMPELVLEPQLPADLPTQDELPAIPDFAPGDTFGITPPAQPEEAKDLRESAEPDAGEPDASVSALLPDFIDWAEDSDSMLEPLALTSDASPQQEAFEDPASPENGVALDLDLITEAILSGEMAAFEDAATPAPSQPAEITERLEIEASPVNSAEAEPEAEIEPEIEAEMDPDPIEAVSVPTPRAELPLPPSEGADALTQLLADPVLMDRLTKAVVARLGDQILREIAWEVMPELADRLQRK